MRAPRGTPLRGRGAQARDLAALFADVDPAFLTRQGAGLVALRGEEADFDLLVVVDFAAGVPVVPRLLAAAQPAAVAEGVAAEDREDAWGGEDGGVVGAAGQGEMKKVQGGKIAGESGEDGVLGDEI